MRIHSRTAVGTIELLFQSIARPRRDRRDRSISGATKHWEKKARLNSREKEQPRGSCRNVDGMLIFRPVYERVRSRGRDAPRA